ncbi:MAG: hypothetical protein NT031_20970 [Planctomycetota bacterium]|nr:hypothetical protein [Planctomycetota bacterium]
MAWVGPGNPRVQEGAEEWGAGGTMSYDTAWREAGERAAAALEGGAVPARHRQLVRDFFGVEGR